MQDLINACFEWAGTVFLLLHMHTLYKQKRVRGVNVFSVGFFSLWGYWNMYYYPSLNQWISGLAAVLLALTNTAYLCMLIYYKKKERNYYE